MTLFQRKWKEKLPQYAPVMVGYNAPSEKAVEIFYIEDQFFKNVLDSDNMTFRMFSIFFAMSKIVLKMEGSTDVYVKKP